MAKFPKVQRMCPVKNSLAEFMDGDICRLCSRQVFDLNAMSEADRMSFIESCTGEVCVSYKVPLRGLAAAVALSAAAVAMPVAAEETLVDFDTYPAGYDDLPRCADELELVEIIVGGIKDPSNVEYIDTVEDLAIPELPVVYEDE